MNERLEEFNCIQIEMKARRHLMKCAVDDFKLSLQELQGSVSAVRFQISNLNSIAGEIK